MTRLRRTRRFTHGLEARITVSVCLALGACFARADAPPLIDDVLDGLQASGKDLKSFTATVKIDDFDAAHASDTFRNGKVALKIKPDGDAQIHLLLNDRQFGSGKPKPERKEILYDNGWLTDRDFTMKNEARHQIRKPGQKLDLFQLGGPFPLPIGQDKKDVHDHFVVALVPPDKDDPAGSTHLTLTPKPGTEYADKYKVIDIWVDPKQKLPVRLATTDPKSNSRTTDLTDLKVNSEVGDGEFKLPSLDPNWHSHDEAMPNN